MNYPTLDDHAIAIESWQHSEAEEMSKINLLSLYNTNIWQFERIFDWYCDSISSLSSVEFYELSDENIRLPYILEAYEQWNIDDWILQQCIFVNTKKKVDEYLSRLSKKTDTTLNEIGLYMRNPEHNGPEMIAFSLYNNLIKKTDIDKIPFDDGINEALFVKKYYKDLLAETYETIGIDID